MAIWWVLGAALALQPADGGAQPLAPQADDPCRFGTYGPPAALSDLRPVELDYAGFETFEGQIPGVDVTDPCGLRFSDLTGVWEFNGYQAVAYHDLRTARFQMRLTHVPYDEPYFETWAMRFGFPVLDGAIGPHAESNALALNSLYPPNVQASCPEQYQSRVEYLTIRLGYDGQGRPLLAVTRPYSLIDSACVETLDRFVTDIIVRTGVEAAP